MRTLGAIAAVMLHAAAQNIDSPAGNWTMEGGTAYREGVISYDGTADAIDSARFYYANLADGQTFCENPTPDTAAATPVQFNGIWIVCDCANKIVGYQNPEIYRTTTGGPLPRLWSWTPNPALAAGQPLLATPVIDPATSMMYVLWKNPNDSKLFALHLNDGTLVPTLVWTLDLSSITGITSNNQQVTFRTWLPDHAILLYGNKVWIPSNDFDGALLVDTVTSSWLFTEGLWDVSHRLQGSVGGAAANWKAPVFVATGSMYGFQSFDPATGNRSWWSDNFFYVPQGEFSHPVAVRFESYTYGRYDCVIGTRWSLPNDPSGGIFISGADANSSSPCGWWSTNGYYIRHPALAMPYWVSAPAVLYDGYQTVYLIYAVVLPSGDRTVGGWRSALVSIQVDQTGPYGTPTDYYIMTGVHFNAAPIVVRNAWGPGLHAVAVGGSDGRVYMFPGKGYSSTGPVISHSLIPLLPPPNNPAYPNADNRRVGISGNYMAATTGGSIAFIAHNPDAEINWFGIVTGAQFSLSSDPSATPTPRPVVQSPSPSPIPIKDNSNGQNGGVDAAGAVFGTMAALGGVAAAIVFFMPQTAAAGYIRSAASATASGVKSLASAASKAVSNARGGSASSAAMGGAYSATAAEGAGGPGSYGGYNSGGGYGSEKSGLLAK